MDSEAALAVIRKDGDYQYGNDGEDIDGLKVRLYFFVAVALFEFLFCSCLRINNICKKNQLSYDLMTQ